MYFLSAVYYQFTFWGESDTQRDPQLCLIQGHDLMWAPCGRLKTLLIGERHSILIAGSDWVCFDFAPAEWLSQIIKLMSIVWRIFILPLLNSILWFGDDLTVSTSWYWNLTLRESSVRKRDPGDHSVLKIQALVWISVPTDYAVMEG